HHTTRASLNDIFTEVLVGGLIAETLHDRWRPAGYRIKDLSCDVPDGRLPEGCALWTELDYVEAPDPSRPEVLGVQIDGFERTSLTPIDGGLRFVGRSGEVTIEVTIDGERVAGPTFERVPLFPGLSETERRGTIRVAFVEIAGDIDVRVGEAGLLEAQFRPDVDVDTGEVTATFPELPDPLVEDAIFGLPFTVARSEVEQAIASRISGPDGNALRESIGSYVTSELSTIMERLLS